MSEYAIRALDASTWDAFARLVEKHNGCGFGGCWCTSFHSREGRPEGEKGRPWKERLVREGNAHAALVFNGVARGSVVGIRLAGGASAHLSPEGMGDRLTGEPPAYRITCIFVDRDYRRKGVAAAAVRGALDLIATAGGGVVEAYAPARPAGREHAGGTVPVQPHAQPLRGRRLQLRATQGKEELRDAHDGFTCHSVTLDSRRRPLGTTARASPRSRRGPRPPRRRRQPERDVVRRAARGFDRAVERFRRKVPAPDASVDRLGLAVTQELRPGPTRRPSAPAPAHVHRPRPRPRSSGSTFFTFRLPEDDAEVEPVVLEEEPDRREVDAAVRIVGGEHCVPPPAQE